MSDEEKKDTPPPAPEAGQTPPSAGNDDKPAAPAAKPQFKVTRSPFTPKVGGAGQDSGPVKLPTPPKPVSGAPKPPAPAAPKPPAPAPVAGAPKPSAPPPAARPKPAKPVPKATTRPGKPAETLEPESASVSVMGVALDAVCAVVAVVFAALIFVGMKG